MPQTDTAIRTPVAAGPEPGSPSDPDVRLSGLLRLKEEMERSRRYSYFDHLGALTDTVVAVHDQGQVTNRRLSHVETDLAEVKTDLAEVKTDLAEVKTDLAEVKTNVQRIDKQLGLMMDEARTTGARVERLVGYVIRDETGGTTAS